MTADLPASPPAEPTQAMIDAAFPLLHGDHEFRDDPNLRATLEGPVREALRAALVAARDTDETTLRTHIAEQIEEYRSPYVKTGDHCQGWNDAIDTIKRHVLAEGAGS